MIANKLTQFTVIRVNYLAIQTTNMEWYCLIIRNNILYKWIFNYFILIQASKTCGFLSFFRVLISVLSKPVYLPSKTTILL
jgi:hypothetical protein